MTTLARCLDYLGGRLDFSLSALNDEDGYFVLEVAREHGMLTEFQSVRDAVDVDVWSYAIEAAEALDL